MKTESRVPGVSEDGVTLVEMMVALGLMSLVFGMMVGFFVTLTRSTVFQNSAADAQHTARAGVEYVVHDLRIAGLDPHHTAGAGIEEISPTGTKVRFTTDRCDQPINSSGCDQPSPDGDLNDQSEEVTYLYDSKRRSLRRCYYESDPNRETCANLIDRVVSNPSGIPLFVFLDSDNNIVTENQDRDRIRAVVFTLTIEAPAGMNTPVTRTYSSRVRLRNIGL
jgi:type II secretory pathway pseudopilin PulG